jgi:Sigma-54 interaction domain
MSDDKVKKKLAKRHELLAAAAFGVHFNLSRSLADHFERKFVNSTFFFYEYFLDRPIIAASSHEYELEQQRDISAPFLTRIARRDKFIPKIDKTIFEEVKPEPIFKRIDYELFEAAQHPQPSLPGNLNDSDILQYLYRGWNVLNNPTPTESLNDVKLSDFFKEPPAALKFNLGQAFQQTADGKGIVAMSATVALEKWEDAYPRKVWDRSSTEKAKMSILFEYGLVTVPWLKLKVRPQVAVIAVSLSSNAIFWGECLLYFTYSGAADDQPVRELIDLLCQYIADTYVPMLTLFENYLCEKDLEDHLIDKCPLQFSMIRNQKLEDWVANHANVLSAIRMSGPFPEGKRALSIANEPGPLNEIEFNNVFYSLLHWIQEGQQVSKLNVLEKSLMEVWADRLVWLYDKKDVDEVIGSLVFAKYLVASPSMTKLVVDAAKVRHEQDGKKRIRGKCKVRTTLIAGGPGSGKDSMAELIALFSPAFRLGKMLKLNMAMFRPKEVAVPLLLGTEIAVTGFQAGAKGQRMSLSGFLKQALESNANVAPGRPAYDSRGGTFIFDELNSLDIDTQGALLRFIENGDLKPLGGLSDPLMQSEDSFEVLIVGVINEHPDLLTKKGAMDGVLRYKQIFGGMLGDFLYETLRTQRRLRDDLYYRFIRGGEIIMPNLRERREDIPALFYVNAVELLKQQKEISDWEIDQSAYEELMDKSLQWEGNLRELQTVTRHTIATALETRDQRLKSNPTAPLRIVGLHVRRALELIMRAKRLDL